MKPVKNFLFAVLLVFTLALTTLAGDIETPGYAPPPPPRMSTTTDETIPETNTETEQTMLETSDYLLFEALAALLSVY
jgi:hypothetical protein